MKMPRLLIVFCLVFFSLLAKAQNWSPASYERNDFSSFARYSPALMPIDFNKVDHALLNASIFYATNQARVAQGLPPFQHHPALEKAAQGHSNDMSEHDFFSHTSPVPGKKDFSTRLRNEGFSMTSGAENIAKHIACSGYKPGSTFSPINGLACDYKTGKPFQPQTYLEFGQSVVEGWLKSPGHRRNILGDYAYLGCGAKLLKAYRYPNMRSFNATQNFASLE